MKTLAHLATRFVGVPVAIHPPKLEIILKALAPRLGLNADMSAIETGADEATKRLVAHYQEAGGERDFAVINGVAVIPVQGTLMKRCSGLDAYSGCCSYEDLEAQISQAVDDAGIQSVLLDIDSPGGEVSGCFELCDKIFQMRGKKPIYAVANDCALSAAYAIASSADRIFVGRTGAVGSVGVFALHAEQSEFDKQIGVAYTYIFAGKNKVDGNPHSPLSERAKAEIQTEVTREYGIFTETVSRNRGADVKEIVGTDARLMWADAAVPLLADEVGTFDDAMSALAALKASKSNSRSKRAASAAEGVEVMADTSTILAAKADEECAPGADSPDSEIKKKASKKEDDKSTGDGKKDPAEDGDDTEGKKAAAAVPALAAHVGFGDLPQASRTEDDIVAIGNLCKMAGVDSSDYLTKKVKLTSGKQRFMSVAEVSNELAEKRSAESGRTAVMNNVDTTAPAGAALTMERLESEAKAFSRLNRNVETGMLYGEGKRKGTTPEQAFAAALEANPQAYEQFRARHNAKGIISQLQGAGVKISFE